MAGTKLSDPSVTVNSPVAGTDKYAILKSGQLSADKYVNTVSATRDYVFSENIYFTGEISPATLTASQNDWNPTGLSTCTHINVTCDAATAANGYVAITGITAPTKDNTFLALYNNGTVPFLLHHQSTSSAAANRFILPASMLMVMPGTLASFVYDLTNARWITISDPASRLWIPDPRQKFVYVNDFMETYSGNTALNINSGTGTTPVNSTYGIFAQKVVGAWQITTGSTTTGRSGLTFSPAGTAFTCALGRYMSFNRIGVNTLSTVAEEYSLKVGGFFGVSVTPGNEVDGVCWAYDRLVDGDFWVCITSNNSSRTKTVTAVPVTTNYIYLGIITNDDWTVVEFVYSTDGISLTRAALHLTASGHNIPTNTRTAVPMIANIIKSAGSTARIVSIDSTMAYYNFLRG